MNILKIMFGLSKGKDSFGKGTPFIRYTDVYNNRFLKKDNIIWEIEKINLYESEEDEQDDWYETNYGIPVMIRMDYAPDEHIDIIHSKSHLTLSNSQNCRIPMKTYFMFSEFVNFILINFYNMHIDKSPVCYNDCVEISNNELKTYHINWE